MGTLQKEPLNSVIIRRGNLSIVSQRHYFVEELRICMARMLPPRTVAVVGQYIKDNGTDRAISNDPEKFLGECIDRGELKLSAFHFDHDKLNGLIDLLAGENGIKKVWSIPQNSGRLEPLLRLMKARIPDSNQIMLRKALTVMETRWDTLRVALEEPEVACIMKNIIDNEDCEDLRTFLASGANPNIRDENNDMAPLHFACCKGDVNMVRLLLAAGAYPNVWDCADYSPLHYACDREDIEIMNTLLERGADPNAPENGISPFYTILVRPEDDVFRKQAIDLLKRDFPCALLGSLFSTKRHLIGKESILEWYRENHPEMLEEIQAGGETVKQQEHFDLSAFFPQGM